MYLQGLPNGSNYILLAREKLQSFVQVYLELNVTVTNFLELSTTKTVTMYRDAKDIPLLRLSDSKLVVRATEKVVVGGMALYSIIL